jgi:hypothetical protein
MSLSAERIEKGKFRVGASEIGALILDEQGEPIHPYLSPLKLFQRKVGDDESETKRHLDWGNDLEQPILRAWARDNEVKLAGPAGLSMISARFKHLLATPDDFIEDGGASGTLYSADAKNVQFRNKHLKEWGAPGTDDAPLLYVAQVAIQIEIAREVMKEANVADRGYLIASLAGAPPDAWIFKRDTDLVGQMEELAARFVRDCLETGRPPDKWWNDPGASEYVKRRFREANEVMRPSDPILRAMGEEVARLRKAKKEAEAKCAAAEALLCSQIGDATGIEGVAKWTVIREARDVESNWEEIARDIARELVPKDAWPKLPEIKDRHTAERVKRKAYRRLYVNGAEKEQ